MTGRNEGDKGRKREREAGRVSLVTTRTLKRKLE